MSFLLRLDHRVSNNALIKFASEIIGRIASFGLVLWAAQQLGEADFGLYNFGLAWGFVLAQLADLGLQLLLAREIAVREEDAQPLVQRAFGLKLLFSLPVALLLLLVARGWSGVAQLSIISLGLMMLANTYLEFVAYVFRGQQRLLAEARVLTLARLAMAAAGFVVLWLGGGLLGLALSNLISTALFALWALWLLHREGWLARPRWSALGHVDWRPYRHLLRRALPLGIAIFLSIAYTRLAIFLLQYFSGELAVAHYSAAYRLVEPTQIVPASLLAAAFPAFSYALHHAPRQARRLGWTVSLLLAGAGTVAAAAFAFFAPFIISLLYGPTYSESVPVLQVLGLSVVLTFVNYSLTHYLIARSQQTAVTLLSAGALLIHTVLCWQFIPRWGAVGPAVSVVTVEALLTCGCLLVLARTQPSRVELLIET